LGARHRELRRAHTRVSEPSATVWILAHRSRTEIWHVWLHDPWRSAQGEHYRRTPPAGTELVWVEARLRIRDTAVAQVGFGYYRNVIEDGCDRNDDDHHDPPTEDGCCEAGKSKYYFETFENGGGWMTVRSNAATWTVNPNQSHISASRATEGNRTRPLE